MLSIHRCCVLRSSQTLELHHRKLEAFPSGESPVCRCRPSSPPRCDLPTKLDVKHGGGEHLSVSERQLEISQLYVSDMRFAPLWQRISETLDTDRIVTCRMVPDVKTPANSESGVGLAVSGEMSEIQRLTSLRCLIDLPSRVMQLLLSLKTHAMVDLSTELCCAGSMLSWQ